MDIDLIFKIAGIGLVVVFLNQFLEQSNRKDQAMFITFAGLIVVVFMLINEISVLFDTIKSVFGF